MTATAATTNPQPTGRLAQLVNACTADEPRTKDQIAEASGIPAAMVHVYLRRAAGKGWIRAEGEGWVLNVPTAPKPKRKARKATKARPKAPKPSKARARSKAQGRLGRPSSGRPRLPTERYRNLIAAAVEARPAMQLAKLADVPAEQVVVYLARAVEAGWLDRDDSVDPPTYTGTDAGRQASAIAAAIP